MWKDKILKTLRLSSQWLFWPGVALIIWGELTPRPPDLSGFLAWDKAEHFTAYFGLASMLTMILGLRPRLALAIGGVILLGGALEILQGYTGRDPDIFDFVANSIGALSGTLAGTFFTLILSPRALVERRRPD